MFECPGCGGSLHSVYVQDDRRPTWAWNQRLDLPTFHPSILVRDGRGGVCHSFVTDGRISYCGDSTHALANQTVDLPEIEP